MSPTPTHKNKTKSPARNPLARLHSPAVMLLLVFMLVVYLVYVLAESFGLEGEGGWVGEVLSAALFIAGIILLAILVGGSLLGIRAFFLRRRGNSPWMDDNETQ